MDGGQNVSKSKGWNAKGMKRFNLLCKTISNDRKCVCSKENELAIKEKYAQIYWRNHRGRVNGKINWDEDRDNGSVKVYDRFVGDLISEATNIKCV